MKPFKVRLSPSGKFIGKPPLLLGSGSVGRVWRKHGAGQAETIPTATATAITGLDTIPVDVRPGYLYEAELFFTLETLGVTTAPVATTYYRLHNASAGTFGPWAMFGIHTVRDNTALAAQQLFEGDAAFGISVSTTCDVIEFGIQGDTTAGFSVLPTLSWAKLTEYLP